MSGDDIVDELRFRATVTRLGGQHTAQEVMSDIMAMTTARTEIMRLRAEVKGLTGERDFNERQLVAEVAKVERLRAAGDAMAEYLMMSCRSDAASDLVAAWREACRG